METAKDRGMTSSAGVWYMRLPVAAQQGKLTFEVIQFSP